jgi:ribosomal-protein-alanine N-acetyltransferase
VIYRLYIPADFDKLYALEEVCFEPPSRFSRRYMRLLVQRSHAATWIAEEVGQLAGFAIVEWTEESSGVPGDGSLSLGYNSDTTAYIQTVEVSPEVRGRGVGRELLSRIEGAARFAGARLIGLHVDEGNAAAIRLYEAQGYRCEGREEDYYPLGRAALIYLKRLDAEAAS